MRTFSSLTVPPWEDGLGMHELDVSKFLYDLNFQEIRQPLPDFHKILTDTRRKQTQNAEGKLGVNTPILKDFFTELSKNTTLNAKDSHPDREEQTEANEIMNLPLIDRPSTILTKGQHTRFKQLLVVFDGKFPKKVHGVAESKAQMAKAQFYFLPLNIASFLSALQASMPSLESKYLRQPLYWINMRICAKTQKQR